MPISYFEKTKTFKLDSKTSSYIIKIYDEGYILNLYYGATIPDSYVPAREKRPTNASFSLANPVIGENGFTPDTAPMEYGCNGAADFRISALEVRNRNGDGVTDVRYTGYKIYSGKPQIPGLPSSYANDVSEAETLELYAEDKVTGLEITLFYTVFSEYGVITRHVRAHNGSDKNLEIERIYSCCVDYPTSELDMISLCGRYSRERNVERHPLVPGIQEISSKRGASGHVRNPFVAFASKNADEEHGDVYGFNLVYSGNFSAAAECDLNRTTRFIMGIDPTDFGWLLEPGADFCTPEVVMVYTDNGVGEMSRIFHRFYNNNLIRGRYKTEKRPLLINSWEAAFFDFDDDKLVDFAKEAKKLGIEMLVMDDGWFGKRINDRSSLGDWSVNEDRLHGGLSSLIERINAEGMKFGIWYEPEMISPDSELYRAHPDYAVRVKGREPMIGRHQYVLDFSRGDVRENIKKQMYDVIANNKIDYIKWDFNRNISDAASAQLPPERQKEFFHRFVLGTYEFMDWLTTTFQGILLETCSGGGGRFDPAMLAYSPQIWASDNTDAIERLAIQFGTSLCYPASAVGAHVSAAKRTGIQTRGNVAMWGTFGYELDPRKLTEDEKNAVREQVREYHENYDLIRNGDLYRLVSPFENRYRAIWEIVSADKTRAMLTIVTKLFENGEYLILKLRGLDERKMYKNSLTGDVCSGALLMKAGVNLSGVANWDGSSKVIYFDEV